MVPKKEFPYVTGYVTSETVYDVVETSQAYAGQTAIPCFGAKSIALHLTEASTNNRSGVLTLYVSIDGGTTFEQYKKIYDNTENTNAQQPTHVTNVTRSSDGTSILWFDPDTLGAITHFKVDLAVTDGGSPAGTFTVQAAIQY